MRDRSAGPVSDDALVELLAALDLEAKVRLVSGGSIWTTAALPEVGLRAMTVSDGPVGVRGARFAEDAHSANLPSPSALSASWDVDLLRRVGQLLAAEAVRHGVDVVLGPTVNLHRSPLGGRHFECLSEDPLLTGRLATAYVRGLQDEGVGACPKHYVANDAETDRTTVDNRVDERTLRELYLAPFEQLVADADPWTVMAAYNGVNGVPMSESALLAEPLKGEWGWDGAVVSDWGAVYGTVASASAKLDLAMPGPEQHWSEALVAAVRAGEVDERDVDDKVLRLLRLAARVGALGPDAPTAPTGASAADGAALAREAAVAGTVLLRNEDDLLPLRAQGLRRVALIGPSALEPRPQGGGSAMVFAPYVVTPQAGLAAALGDGVEVVTALGAPLSTALRAPHSDELDGVRLRWCDPDGAVLLEQEAAAPRLFRSGASIPPGASSVEVVTRFVPSSTGDWRLGVSGVGTFALELDGQAVLHETVVRDRMDMHALLVEPPQSSVRFAARQGEAVEVRLRYRWAEDFFLFRAGFAVESPRGTADEEVKKAVDAARSADVAVVVVGTSEAVESEGFDRESLRLPGRQDDLVRAVAAVNPRTVVVVNAGSPVELPWRDQVGAVLVTWFPGMELGHALADVLLGAAEPGGRLPTTWPTELAAAPVTRTTPVEGVLRYDEGLHVGHRGYLRAGTQPAYWFGHGLGYTRWEHVGLTGTAERVVVTVRNTGQRRGKQVVQVYASRPDSALDRAALVLAGFAVVCADPGEQVGVEVVLDRRVLRHWDVEQQRWDVEAGALVLHAGPHAGDLPLVLRTALA